MTSPPKTPTSPPKSPLRGIDPRDLFLLKKQGRHMQEKRGIAPLQLQRTGYKTPPSMRSPTSPGRSVECGGYRQPDYDLRAQSEQYVRRILTRKREEDKQAGGIRSGTMAHMEAEGGEEGNDDFGDEDEGEGRSGNVDMLDKFPTPPGGCRPSSWSSVELRSIISALDGIMNDADIKAGEMPVSENSTDPSSILMAPSVEHRVRIHEAGRVSDGSHAIIESPLVDRPHREMFQSIIRDSKDHPGGSAQISHQRLGQTRRNRDEGGNKVMDQISEPKEASVSTLGRTTTVRRPPSELSRHDRMSLKIALDESEDSVLPSKQTMELDAKRERWQERKAELKHWLNTGDIPDKYYEQAGVLPPSKGGKPADHE